MTTSRLRGAFTLVEMLVIIAIIAILASLLLPATVIVRNQAKTTQCTNNLRQIGQGIIGHQELFGDGRDVFPGRLGKMFDADGVFGTSGLQGEDNPTKKILICPFDGAGGTTRRSNRAAEWTDLDFLLANEPYDLSYFYETSEEDFTFDSWVSPAMQPRMPADPTWADFKRAQFYAGNRHSGSDGYAFPADQFPIVRCYWHRSWSGKKPQENLKEKVLNVAWSGTVFWSIPFWEHGVNPKEFDLP